MQQRFGTGCCVEVAGLYPENKIRNESSASQSVPAQVFILAGQQKHPAKRQNGGKHDDQRGQNPLATPCVEIEKAEGSSIELPEDDGRDQESGNHKEDINADIATRKDARFSMEPDYRQHRHSTKAVDLRTIVQGFRIMLTHKVSTMTWGHDFSNFGYPRQDRSGFAGYPCDIRKEYTLRDVSK